MITTPTIPTYSPARLIDAALLEIQDGLTTQLSWLNTAFGKAQRLVRRKDGREVFYPGVWYGEADYLPVFPDGHIGNFSFFDVEDGQTVEREPGFHGEMVADFGLVFWFDFRDVYPVGWELRTTENVKADVLSALKAIKIDRGAFRINQIFERAENMYPGYTISEIDDQFLMRPYGGFRIEGELRYYVDCI